MNSRAQVCITCRRIRTEGGVWAQRRVPSSGHPSETPRPSICPTCSYERFPQYYEKVPVRRKKWRLWIGRLVSTGGVSVLPG